MKLLVQGPNRHTKLTKKLQGAVTPRDDTIMRLPYTGQDFWRILYTIFLVLFLDTVIVIRDAPTLRITELEILKTENI